MIPSISTPNREAPRCRTPTVTGPHSTARNYWRPRADAAELRTLRRRDRVATRQTVRTAKDWDDTVWPAYRRAAIWQLPSY